MVLSMTGFGQASATVQNKSILIEIQSVNRRFFDAAIFMPKELISVENDIRTLLEKHISRGHITVRITFKSGEEEVLFELSFLKKIKKSLDTIKKELHISEDIDMELLLQLAQKFPFLGLDPKKCKKPLLEAIKTAVDQLIAMRKAEGCILKKDLVKRIEYLKSLLLKIQKKAPLLSEKVQKNLYKKLEALDVFDEERVLRETVIYAEKTDITEEIVRLDAHLGQIKKIIDSSGAIGKKLDFLLQEMVREINTIGVKGQDVMISSSVIEFKSELEKIKEQVQNIE